MAFTKSFPKDIPNSRYPEWVEVSLTEAEEAKIEAHARENHIRLLQESLHDAIQLVKEEQLKDYQTNMVQLAMALFEKRASHTVWHKEEAARIKFEKQHKSS